MPKSLSQAIKADFNATSGDAPLMLLEITHADLAQPIRVVRSFQNLEHGGNTYIGLMFDVTWPDDPESGAPRAALIMDNVGRELTYWLEVSRGGAGASCKIILVRMQDTEPVETSVEMNLTNLSLDQSTVRGELNFDELLNLPGVAARYDQTTTPGIF